MLHTELITVPEKEVLLLIQQNIKKNYSSFSLEELSKFLYSLYVYRTRNHIAMVNNVAQFMEPAFIKCGFPHNMYLTFLDHVAHHDEDKLSNEPEAIALQVLGSLYKYSAAKEFYEPSEYAKFTYAQKTCAEHSLNNLHHPESWADASQTESGCPYQMTLAAWCKDHHTAERDLFPYLAEMISDWSAVGIELKNDTPEDWFEMHYGKNWVCDDTVKRWITVLCQEVTNRTLHTKFTFPYDYRDLKWPVKAPEPPKPAVEVFNPIGITECSGSYEVLSAKVLNNIKDNKVYHSSPMKLDILSGHKSKTSNAEGSVFVSPFKWFSSMFILNFHGIVDAIEKQIDKKHIKIDNFGFTEWNQTPSSTTELPSMIHVLVRTEEEFKSFTGEAKGYLYTIDLSKYDDKVDMWSGAKDSDVEFIIRGDVKYEKCESITLKYEVMKETPKNRPSSEALESDTDLFPAELANTLKKFEKYDYACLYKDGALIKDQAEMNTRDGSDIIIQTSASTDKNKAGMCHDMTVYLDEICNKCNVEHVNVYIASHDAPHYTTHSWVVAKNNQGTWSILDVFAKKHGYYKRTYDKLDDAIIGRIKLWNKLDNKGSDNSDAFISKTCPKAGVNMATWTNNFVNNGQHFTKWKNSSIPEVANEGFIASKFITDGYMYHGSSNKYSVLKPQPSEDAKNKPVLFLTPFKRVAAMYVVNWQDPEAIWSIARQYKRCKVVMADYTKTQRSDEEMQELPKEVHIYHNIKDVKTYSRQYTGYVYTVKAADVEKDCMDNPVWKGRQETMCSTPVIHPVKTERVTVTAIFEYDPKKAGVDHDAIPLDSSSEVLNSDIQLTLKKSVASNELFDPDDITDKYGRITKIFKTEQGSVYLLTDRNKAKRWKKKSDTVDPWSVTMFITNKSVSELENSNFMKLISDGYFDKESDRRNPIGFRIVDNKLVLFTTFIDKTGTKRIEKLSDYSNQYNQNVGYIEEIRVSKEPTIGSIPLQWKHKPMWFFKEDNDKKVFTLGLFHFGHPVTEVKNVTSEKDIDEYVEKDDF